MPTTARTKRMRYTAFTGDPPFWVPVAAQKFYKNIAAVSTEKMPDTNVRIIQFMIAKHAVIG